jgi:hypothetical protein
VTGLQPDGKFRPVGNTGIEVALSTNGKQVCIRRPNTSGQTVVTSARAWQDFVESLRRRESTAP